MGKIRLNILNSVMSRGVSDVTDVDLNSFWEYYFSIISLRGARLTPVELSIMCYIMSGDSDVNYFVGKGAVDVMSYFGFTRQQFWFYKKSLVDKGYVYQQDSGRRIFVLQKGLQDIRLLVNRVKGVHDLEFVLPFRLK